MPRPDIAVSRDASGPRLQGRWVNLRPVVPTDYDFLYRLSVSDEAIWRWRNRGATPRPEDFHASLWSSVLVQFILETKRHEPIGNLMLYAPNLPDGYAYVGIVLASTYTLEGWPLEGLVLLLDYAFMMWDLRKLYGEILGVNWSSWSRALGRYFQEEGQLKEHTFFGGRWWDMHIVAVYRDDWLNRTKLKTTAAQPT